MTIIAMQTRWDQKRTQSVNIPTKLIKENSDFFADCVFVRFYLPFRFSNVIKMQL